MTRLINADGRDVTAETIASLRKVMAGGDLAKAETVTLSSGLVAYDLSNVSILSRSSQTIKPDVALVLETRDHDHIDLVKRALAGAGLQYQLGAGSG